MKNKRLLIFACDAASANVAMAYAYLYAHKYSEIKAFGTSIAHTIFIQHIKNYISTEPVEFLATDTVVTGTSGLKANYELNIIKEAKLYNVQKIIMIVDSTSNFTMRFSLNNKIVRTEYLPNKIWVFEKDFKSGIPILDERIIYKANIYQIFLKVKYIQNPPVITHEFIQTYKNNYLVILTEYLYELYSLKFGFTEYDMLENILETIESLNINIPIVLKLHPKENNNKFNIILRKYSHLNLIKGNCNIQELVYYSKVIFGINSSVFMESKLFKKPTYSIQIDSKKYMKTTLSIDYIIYSKKHLISILTSHFD